MQKITIFGGGLVGSLLSIYLAKRKFEVEIFERRSDLRHTGGERGRSINLALSDRGWRSLSKADSGLVTKIKEFAIPMHGRMVHPLEGEPKLQPYGKEGQYIYSVSRSDLNRALIDVAESYGVKFNFSSRCDEINLQLNEVTLENTRNGDKTLISPEVTFGADGAFSVVRSALIKTDRFNYSQFYLDYGYKELTIAANSVGQHQLFTNALHIWPRKSFMLIALPNPDGSFTCTLFLAFRGEYSFDSLSTIDQVEGFFSKHFPDAYKLMPNLGSEFFSNPTSSLVTIKCFPWSYQFKYALIGDASHAIVPFYGQGMNAGFEDCYVLDKILEAQGRDWGKILEAFEKERKPDTDAIAELAFRNFTEMRDLVADDQFLLRKKIENKLSTLFPDDWVSLYSMVTFSEMRYSQALQLGKIQDEIMNEVLDISGIETSWTNLDFEGIIKKYKGIQRIKHFRE